MATFITSKSVGETIQFRVDSSTGFWKYIHNGIDSSVQTNGFKFNISVTNANGEFTIIPCDSNGNVSGNITLLNIGSNQITSFDKTGLTEITSLFLDDNQLTSIDVTGLSSLIDLRITLNQLTSFDGTGLSNLTRLWLQYNQISTFDGTGLVNLISYNSQNEPGLNLSNNPLTTFIGGDMGQLTSISFDSWQITTLTSFDGAGLSGLTYLSLRDNQLTSFDGTGLSSLTDLGLYSNQLTTFDGTGLSSLTSLNLYGNPLTSFDGTGLPSTMWLDMSQFDLTNINQFIFPADMTYVDLVDKQLTSLDIFVLPTNTLIGLNLSGNLLTTFDGTGLSSLTSLNLNGNPLTSFIGGDMGQLTELNFQNWGITTLTSFDSAGLSGLTYLNLGGNQSLTTFDWTGLSSLTYLSLSNYQLTSFDGTGLSELSSLTGLSLAENQLTSLDLSSLSNLNNLDLNNNQLTSLDGFIFPASLHTLYLRNNLFTTFDGTGLSNLNYLYLSNNPLTTFIGGDMSSLQELYLDSDESITTLTSFDGAGLSGLTSLSLRDNQLTSFDGTGLSSLTSLNLYNNPLVTFVGGDMQLTQINFNGWWGISTLTSFDGGNMTQLTNLDLYNNQITSFNGGNLTNITYLNLAQNGLTSLDGFVFPPNMNYLNLPGNQFTSFNGVGMGLTNLIHLNLSNNSSLTSFDGTGLDNINSIYIYDGQLTSVNVAGLNYLNDLELDGNPMTPLANNQVLQQLNQNGVQYGYFSSNNGRTSASNSDYDNLLNNLYWGFSGLDLIAPPVVGNGRLAIRGVINTPPFVPQEGSFTVNVTGTEYTYMGIGSSTGYIKIRYWDGVEEILGNGDTSTYVPDEYNTPSSLIWFEKAITDSTPNKTINYYPCLSDGTMSGEIIYLNTQEAYAYQPVLPQTLKGLWLLSYNRSSSLDLTSLTLLETFIYRDSTTLTTIDLSNISTLKLVMVGNQTESVFPLENILISNPSNLDKFKVYGCGISQFDVSTVSNANKLWLEGTSLVSLDLSESNATELDIRNSQLLTSLSLPTGVIYLTIGSAPLLSNLDLTGLSNVTILSMENVPSLETLDVSDLVNLTVLGLQQGWTPDNSARIPLNITSLDLSNNTLLTHLTYELSIPETLDLTNNNNLILFNVANATNLTSVVGLSNIATLVCSNSQSLDLDSILNDVNVEQLNLSNIVNTALDLSQQTNLAQLSINNSGVNALLPLESINLSGLNNLGFIGVSKVSGAVLDDALIDLNGNTKTSGYFYNATGRSSASNSAVSGLISKGWTIQSW